jgi:hypothetical protein
MSNVECNECSDVGFNDAHSVRAVGLPRRGLLKRVIIFDHHDQRMAGKNTPNLVGQAFETAMASSGTMGKDDK